MQTQNDDMQYAQIHVMIKYYALKFYFTHL